jgi:hypothetical protein
LGDAGSVRIRLRYLLSAVLLFALLPELALETAFELPLPLPELPLAGLELLLEELSEADDAIAAPFPFPLPLSLLAQLVSEELSDFADPFPEAEGAGVPLFLA